MHHASSLAPLLVLVVRLVAFSAVGFSFLDQQDFELEVVGASSLLSLRQVRLHV